MESGTTTTSTKTKLYKMKHCIIVMLLALIGCGSLSAQETVPIRDTIKQSVIVDSRIMRQQQGLTTIPIIIGDNSN